MSDNYYNKKYEINPRIREMIEKRMGKQYDLSHVQIENILSNVVKGEYKKPITSYTQNDKDRMISNIKENSPNRMETKILENINNFMVDNFNTDEYTVYLDYCIKKYYKPGMVYNGVRIFNGGTIELVKMSNLYNLKPGVIINKKYVNDLLPLFNNDETKLKFNEKNLLVEDDFTDYITDMVNGMKLTVDIEYFNTPELFIVSCNNDDATTFLKDKLGFQIQDVLDFKYYEVEEEIEDDGDTMDLGNGIIMKGNFTNLGNIGGTQVIGVGASSGNSILDQLAQEDAMEKLNRIMNGDMSGIGHDEDNDDNDVKEPKDYYFTVQTSQSGDELDPAAICLVGVDFFNKHNGLDSDLGSHSLQSNILTALENAGIFSETELMEGIWEVSDYKRTEQDIVDAMIAQGFIHNPMITQTNGNGDNGNNGGKIDCNDPNYPNRSVLERIFASEEWKEDKHLPKELRTPDLWEKEGSEKMYSDLDDSDDLLSNPKHWFDNHGWDSRYVHPNATSFQGQKVNGFYYVMCGNSKDTTDRDINIFMVGDVIIGWYYHED